MTIFPDFEITFFKKIYLNPCEKYIPRCPIDDTDSKYVFFARSKP